MSRHVLYPSKKPSGLRWIGDIPAHWEMRRIKYTLTEKKTKKGTSLPCGAISFGQVVLKDSESIPEETRATYQEVLAGEFLINPINLNYDLKSLRTALSRLDVRVSPAYIVAKSDSKSVRQGYVEYLLHLFDIANMKTLGAGVRQTITFSDIGNCVWCLPPMAEQETICSFLDRETSRIDSLISMRVRFIELLTEKILTIVMLAVPTKDTQYIRLAHLCSVISRPVTQSKGESYVRLGVLNRGRGLFKKDETDSEDMGDSDFFWVEEGDLILSGQFAWEGAVAMADAEHAGCVVSHRFPIIRGNAEIVLTEYLLAFFMTEYGNFLLNDCSRGSAGRNRPLNTNHLFKQKIPVANKEVQWEVARLLRLRKKLIDKSVIQIQLLKEHRSALITAAVTGKIDVREAA